MSTAADFNTRSKGFASVEPVPFAYGGGWSWEIFDEGAYAGGGRTYGPDAEAEAVQAAEQALAAYWGDAEAAR